jgi:hypothetical protein
LCTLDPLPLAARHPQPVAVQWGTIQHTRPLTSCIVLFDAWPWWLYVLSALQLSCQAVFTAWPVASALDLPQPIYPLSFLSLATHTQRFRFSVILVQSAVWLSMDCFPHCWHVYPVLWSLPRGVSGNKLVSSTPSFHLMIPHAQVGGPWWKMAFLSHSPV